MSEIAERYRKVAAGFSRRVEGVAPDGWDVPAPCEGWMARDVVGHLVGWVPSFFFEQWGLDWTPGPPATEDPVAAWRAIDLNLQAALDDPVMAATEADTRMGRVSFESRVDMICTPDLLVHTWDLARATGQDETLDPDEALRMFTNMEPMDEMIRGSGQFGPRVAVPDDADPQTKLIAFTGRDPQWARP